MVALSPTFGVRFVPGVGFRRFRFAKRGVPFALSDFALQNALVAAGFVPGVGRRRFRFAKALWLIKS